VILASGGIFRSAHTLQSRGLDLSAQSEITPEAVAENAEAILTPTGLRGFADSEGHRKAALEIVRGVPGVIDTVDETVIPSAVDTYRPH